MTTTKRSVLVVGANGYIGLAVCRAFARAGWRVFGLVRRPEAASSLYAAEVTPLIGSLSDQSLPQRLYSHTTTIDAIVGCAEPVDYSAYFQQLTSLIRRVAETSNKNGVRPLVLLSSGCKDYGTTDVDGAPGLAPHTETSPINPPAQLVARAATSTGIFELDDVVDAAVLRPTNVYGLGSSYYGLVFDYASRVAAAGGAETLSIGSHPGSIMHALHVDDCAEAYVALAERAPREKVNGQCFNISASRYETTRDVLTALAREYKFPGGAVFRHELSAEARSGPDDDDGPALTGVFGFSQWVDSGKIRACTGWTEKKMLFSEDLHVYRMAYEAALASDGGETSAMRTKLEERWYQGNSTENKPTARYF
ncbi:NAD(P)-binding protein [Apiospora kogelbergensis]|uniref:NAD(P)-binding protein n=1 Tax=Apiospora kogelbergensis TaxID=1337665 RepID=A0AAW0R1K8_9PEZI